MTNELDNKFLNKSQFAVFHHCSPSYVTKLGKQGRLVMSSHDQKLIDVEATQALIHRTSDPSKVAVQKHHQSARFRKASDFKNVEDADIRITDPNYWHFKTKREGALAERAELELGLMRGIYVERNEVESLAMSCGRRMRDTLLGLPTRLAAEIASMTNATAIEIKLRDAFSQAFADLEKMQLSDLKRLSELKY